MTFSDLLKSAGEYITLPGRDLTQSIKDLLLANQVKRVEAPNYTTAQLAAMGNSRNFNQQAAVQNYKNNLANSQANYSALQKELANPTANSFLNRVLNISPEQQTRQSGSQLFGYEAQHPQGMVVSPEMAKSAANI